MNGGSGVDTASYEKSSAGVNVNLQTGIGSGGDAQGDALTSIEILLGSSYNDTLTGSGNNDVLLGVEGNDVLYGLDGDDRLDSGTGSNTLFGGEGNDIYRLDGPGKATIEDYDYIGHIYVDGQLFHNIEPHASGHVWFEITRTYNSAQRLQSVLKEDHYSDGVTVSTLYRPTLSGFEAVSTTITGGSYSDPIQHIRDEIGAGRIPKGISDIEVDGQDFTIHDKLVPLNAVAPAYGHETPEEILPPTEELPPGAIPENPDADDPIIVPPAQVDLTPGPNYTPWNPLDPALSIIQQIFEAALQWLGGGGGDPLVLDLDGDGIELVSLADSTAQFDLNGDSVAEQLGWVAPDDGLLVYDANSNGVIDNIGELFGSPTTFGLDILAGFDTNSDGAITSADAQFSNLKVWRDLDQDGLTDSGELSTLGQLGITSISLSEATMHGQLLAGNPTNRITTFTDGNGTHALVEALFLTSNINTQITSTGNGFGTVDLDALFMPLSRGYGALPAFHYALSDDDTLKQMVRDLRYLDYADPLALRECVA